MKLRIVTLLIAGTLVAATSGTAHATNVAAATGHDINYANESCMRNDWNSTGAGAVKNLCSGPELWIIELPVNSSGAKTVTVRGSRNMIAATQCFSSGLDQDGQRGSNGWSGWQSFGTSGLSGDTITLTLKGATVPANGRLQVQCNVAVNLSLFTIHYDM